MRPFERIIGNAVLMENLFARSSTAKLDHTDPVQGLFKEVRTVVTETTQSHDQTRIKDA